MEENKKQVILPMEEYERLIAAQPEKIVEVKEVPIYVDVPRVAKPAAFGVVFGCIIFGVGVSGIFLGWGWWCAIPFIFTVGSLGASLEV